jgi:hypothetical protein
MCVLLLKFEESSQKLRFRSQLVRIYIPGGFAAATFCKEECEIGCKVQVKLTLGAYLLKHQLSSCGVEVLVLTALLGLEVLQMIDKPVHQVVIAELVGQDKGWQEVLLKEIAGR